MAQSQYLKLGEILIKERLVTQSQLDQAMLVQRRDGGRIGEILVRLGALTESDMAMALGRQLNIPHASLKAGALKPALDQGLEKLVPMEFAYKNCVVPLSRNLNSLTCAISDPLDLVLLDNLKKMTGCEINLVISSKTDLVQAAEDFYGKANLLQKAVKESYGVSDVNTIDLVESGSEDTSLSIDRLVAFAEEAPVIKLVDLLIRQAIDERASDIHVEPYRDRIRIRYRIDGKLYDIPPPAKHLHVAIVSRIKILCRLDIAEKRLPQDGAFRVNLNDRGVDLRVSCVPTIYGEKVVLRILDRSRVQMDLDAMGFESNALDVFRRAIKASYGLIFLCGPTGSGKTTTLYAALNEVKDPTKNILTIEDPVEYRLDGINQVQVKSEIGLTFAAALRAFLRQDPDVMLVGEVRDVETAEICIRSALTGHLVLSTLHTNDAPSAIVRLIDIGVEPYLLMPSLLAVISQRLVRKLCPDCKEAFEPDHEYLGKFKINADLIYRAKGCKNCNHCGYRGRTLIAEAMAITNTIRELIHKDITYRELRQAAVEGGMESLLQCGLKKVEKGITSLEEVLSVTLGIE